MPRQVSYRWCVRQLMATRSMSTVAELIRHLAERGIILSSSQVGHRLVSGTSERLSCWCWPPSVTSSSARLPI
ncbi:hypothetical protein OK006_8529 [Actinobacteria bacterium OK006]|nr:hypothetical protein OK006_8529 [Actinobacteria bacterium OK006]